MVVAVVGSRKGALLEDVQAFLTALHAQHPDATVVSGGADGVDKTAERGWYELGGKVISLRPRNIPSGSSPEYWIERWTLDPGGKSRVEVLRDQPSFADRASCALYSLTLIVQYAERVVAFQSSPPDRDTTILCGFAREADTPAYVYSPRERFAGE